MDTGYADRFRMGDPVASGMADSATTAGRQPYRAGDPVDLGRCNPDSGWIFLYQYGSQQCHDILLLHQDRMPGQRQEYLDGPDYLQHHHLRPYRQVYVQIRADRRRRQWLEQRPYADPPERHRGRYDRLGILECRPEY